MVAPPHGRRGRAFVIGSCVGAVGTGKREGCADPCPTGLCFAAIQPSDERCLWLGVIQGGRRGADAYRPAGNGSRPVRKSVEWGKRVAVCEDIGGGRIYNENTKTLT